MTRSELRSALLEIRSEAEKCLSELNVSLGTILGVIDNALAEVEYADEDAPWELGGES